MYLECARAVFFPLSSFHTQLHIYALFVAGPLLQQHSCPDCTTTALSVCRALLMQTLHCSLYTQSHILAYAQHTNNHNNHKFIISHCHSIKPFVRFFFSFLTSFPSSHTFCFQSTGWRLALVSCPMYTAHFPLYII